MAMTAHDFCMEKTKDDQNMKIDERILLQYAVFGYLLGSKELRDKFKVEHFSEICLIQAMETIKRYDSGDETVREDVFANYKVDALCVCLGATKEPKEHLPDALLRQVIKNGTVRLLRNIGRDLQNEIKVDEKIERFKKRLNSV